MERQQHLEEQHRLHVSGALLDQYNETSGVNNTTNMTDHVDDFIARIEKLRQVQPQPQSSMLQIISPCLCFEPS